MLLEKELESLGCEGDSSEFINAIHDLNAQVNRGHSVDSLICRWWDLRDFCKEIRVRFGLTESADDLIARTLVNQRRKGAVIKVGRRSEWSSLQAKLEQVIPGRDANAFRAMMSRTYRRLYYPMTAEQVLCRWRDSSHFCGVLCNALGVERNIEIDALILAAFLGMRKAGQLGKTRATS